MINEIITMTNQNNITLYKVEELLLIHWQRKTPFSGEKLKCLLNDHYLPQPFLALQMANPLEMLLITDARQHKLSALKNHIVIQSADDHQLIEQAQQARILIFPKKQLSRYDQTVQARFFTRLLIHVQEKFKDFSVQSIIALIKRYAIVVKEVYQIENELFFVRLPWQLPVDNRMLPLQLTQVNGTGCLQVSEKTPGLYCDHALHLFVTAKALDKQLAILSYSDLGHIPVLFKGTQEATRQRLLEKLQLKSHSTQILKNFILPKTQPTPPVQVTKRQVTKDFKGKVQGLKQQCIVGWAQNQANLDQPVSIDIYEGSQKLTTVLANRDCQEIGIKPLGHCAFVIPLDDKWLQGQSRQIDLKYANTDQPLPGSPVKLGDGTFDFKLTVQQGETVCVQFQQRTLSNATYTIRLLLDGQPFSLAEMSGGEAFELLESLPKRAFDGREHLIQLNIFNAENKLLYTILRKIKHQYQGALEQANYHHIKGWLADTAYPEHCPAIDVIINDQLVESLRCDQIRTDVQQKYQLPTNKFGFSLAITEPFLSAPYLRIALYYQGTQTLVMPQQTIVTAKDTIIRSLIHVAEYLKSSPQEAPDRTSIDANAWTCRQVIEPTIKALRQQVGIPKQIHLPLASQVSQVKLNKAQTIDVIIPVYQGYDETIDCLHSVLQAKNNAPIHIQVINDCSPDGRLKYKLQAMAQEHHFTLLENQENLGFVATVNKGMRLNPDRDVILLNSDTVVTDGWIDRLLAASLKNQNIATVTPFSNNATICSFPQFNQDNDFSGHSDLKTLNDLFYQQNKGEIIDLPTAVGFCMLIKRETLLEVGYFDEKKWQKGYGEENDFCLRAATMGWRHVLACDVFVQHHGSVSFAETKKEHITRNLTLLDQMYPDYAMTVQRFIQQDPIAKARNKVIKVLLKQQSGHYMLFVMHGLGGGTKTHGDHLTSLLETQNQAVLELSVINKNIWQLQSVSSGYSMIYQYPDDYTQLLNDLSELGISQIHFHQTLGFPKQIWQLTEQLNVPYYFTAHDFMPLCPRINLIDETGYYCHTSQLDVNKCQRCVTLNGTDNKEAEQHLREFDESVESWREYYQNILQQADQVFFPSKSTATIYQQHFALPNAQVKPHPEESFTITAPIHTEHKKFAVAIIGAIGDHKGYQLLLNCAKNALKEDLPLHFVVVGYTRDNLPLAKLDNVTITGEYKDATELTAFLHKHPCQLAAFLSVWPETFCYTLTEALRHNLYPVSLNYGAVAERLKALNYGEIIAEHSTATEINQALLKAGKSLSKKEKILIPYPGAEYQNLLKDYYHFNDGA